MILGHLGNGLSFFYLDQEINSEKNPFISQKKMDGWQTQIGCSVINTENECCSHNLHKNYFPAF
jgi:hypothetical protein